MESIFSTLCWRQRQVRLASKTEKEPVKDDSKWAQWDIDNCTILGWLFKSMEESIYNMFIYYDTVSGLWAALQQMYGHAHNDACIFELYQDVSYASQETQGLSVAEFFGYLQSRWAELAQYEPLSEFPAETASIVVKRETSDITLTSVLHIPNFAFNLLSVSRLAKNLHCVAFSYSLIVYYRT